eukprot:TRINITY_DN5027_c0_g1_i1.p1 TRINITY_DN5027_c0_g1~~TRINITY_DN5027_c0_g1_i1.p1  ORF type:complete len:241 (+),score=71.82 TRINITY_DN5027_c0_g1_i1:85-807(+)
MQVQPQPVVGVVQPAYTGNTAKPSGLPTDNNSLPGPLSSKFNIGRDSSCRCCGWGFQYKSVEMPENKLTHEAYHEYHEGCCREIGPYVVDIKQNGSVIAKMHRSRHVPCVCCQEDATADVFLGATASKENHIAHLQLAQPLDLCCGACGGNEVLTVSHRRTGQRSDMHIYHTCARMRTMRGTGALQGVNVASSHSLLGFGAGFSVDASSRPLSPEDKITVLSSIILGDFLAWTLKKKNDR